MLHEQRILAVIPARAGSKRLPGKNIKMLHGKPLINWTVEAATACDFVDQVVVTSDCDEILRISSLPGVTPHKREASLASDSANSIDVALDVLSRFREFDIVVWLQPTSPLRTTMHIMQALNLYSSMAATSVVSVCPAKYSPQIVNSLDEKNQLSKFQSLGLKTQRSQDYAPVYQVNGAIYITNRTVLIKRRQFLLPESYAYIMDPEYSVDIDSHLDFKFSEFLFEYTRDRMTNEFC